MMLTLAAHPAYASDSLLLCTTRCAPVLMEEDIAACGAAGEDMFWACGNGVRCHKGEGRCRCWSQPKPMLLMSYPSTVCNNGALRFRESATLHT